MATTEQVVSVFLASPGDVSQERDLVGSFVNEWNNLWSADIGLHLRLIRWETHAFPAVGQDGQDVINTQIGDTYDFFLGIMWKRFGTPTPRAASGTVDEFEQALSRYKSTGAPQLIFYFKEQSDFDAKEVQAEAVRKFRSRLEGEGLLHWPFKDSAQFSQLVRVHLTRHLQAWAKRSKLPQEALQAAPTELQDRYENYLNTVKVQSVVLAKIVGRFAKTHLEYITAHSRRIAAARKVNDQTPDLVWKLMLIEIAEAMSQYANAAEAFESEFVDAFTVFIGGALGAGSISIAFRSAGTKGVQQTLVELRRKIRPAREGIKQYVAQLSKLDLSGAMATSNSRIMSAYRNFLGHLRFAEQLLAEAEDLFKSKL